MLFVFPILAQSDGEILRTIKEPGFSQFLVYALVLVMIGDKIYNWVNRGKAGKMEVTGSVEASEKLKFADVKEVERLRVDVENLREENTTQHHATIQAGEKRVTDLARVMDQETEKITQRISGLEKDLMEKLDRNFERLGDKLEKVSMTVAQHGVGIDSVDKRISELGDRYTTAIPKIHERIDDAMKAAAAASAGGGKRA